MQKKWKWTDEKISLLIESIMAFKVKCESNNVDFSSNLVQMYIEVHSSLAKPYPEDFGMEKEKEASERYDKT